MNDIVTVQEAAQFLRKHPGTIRHWIETKKLKARHISAGGHGIYAILRTDLLELAVTSDLDAKEKLHHEHTSDIPANQKRLPI